MINEKQAKKYCKEYWKIENFEKAILDSKNMWDCHHILGLYFTKEMLIEGGNYFDVEPECLIFLTRKEHKEIHKDKLGKCHTEEAKQKMRKSWNYEKHITESWRKKQSEINSGKNNPMYGKHWKLVDGKRVYY